MPFEKQIHVDGVNGDLPANPTHLYCIEPSKLLA